MASRTSGQQPQEEKEPEQAVENKKHTPLPKAMEDTTQPIMYIDKTTGFLQVDMMWTCTKCSYAYNKVEAHKCEVCNMERVLPKENQEETDNDIQLVNSEVIKVCT